MRTKKIAGYQSQTWNSYTFNTPLWNCTKWSFDKKLLFSSGLLIHVQYLQQFQVKFVVINYMSTAESRVHQRLLKTLLWRPTRHVDLSSGFVTFKSISLLEILWFCWFSTPYFAIFSPWHSWVAWVTVLQRIRAIFFGIWSTWSATVGRACFPILVIFTWFCNPVVTSWCGPKVGAIQWISKAGKTSVKFLLCVPEVLSMTRTPATKHVIFVFSSLIRLFKQRLTNLKQWSPLFIGYILKGFSAS